MESMMENEKKDMIISNHVHSGEAIYISLLYHVS